MSGVVKVQNMSPEDVKERLKNGQQLQVIDVREPGEVASGKIPGATNIPLSQIPERIHEIDPNTETIMVCRSGGRSARACEYLASQGHRNAKNMVGRLEKGIEELRRHADGEVFVVCRTGNRSDTACQILAEQGFTHVKNVVPGMSAWEGPIEQSEVNET